MYGTINLKRIYAVAIAGTMAAFVNVAWADGQCGSAGNPCPVETINVNGPCGAACVGTGLGSGGGGLSGGGVDTGMVTVGRQTIPLPPLPAGRFTRTTPACLREQLAQSNVSTFLMNGGNPMIATDNGFYRYTEIFAFRGTMVYPAGPYWTKMQLNFVDPDGGYLVSIHFEWNVSTSQFTYPPHFSSTAAMGCGT